MKKILFFIFLNILLIGNVFSRDLTIDVDKSGIKKINIVFEPIKFIGDKNGTSKNIDKIINNIKSNLYTTNLFYIQNSRRSIFDNYFEVKDLSQSDFINLVVSNYSKTTVDAVLSGFLTINSQNQLELRIKLWDILDQRELFAKYYIVDDNNWKRIADSLSDNIYEFLTGELLGHFDSKILFVAESGAVDKRKRRVAMMDFDGSNLQYITSGNSLVLTPIFSKYNKSEIVYLDFKDQRPNLYKLNILNNQLSLIGNLSEMTFAPNFNPNNENEIIFSATKEGISNIFKLNFDNKKVKQLTYNNAISTVPSFSPDGDKVVFVSDKTGRRKIYTMDVDGKNIQEISKGRGVYDKPSWSPDGKLISFVKMEGGRFSIGLMTPKGESERIILNAYLVEGIKWSPNGRYLIYTKQNGAFGKDSIPGIYTIDILTLNEYKLPTPENQGASDPDWIKK